MAGLTDQLRQRVEQTKLELEDAKKKTQQARATEEVLVAELVGYERALAAEERRDGKAAPVIERKTDALESDAPVNKTAFADEFIRSRNGTGVTAPELFKAFGEAGVEVHRNYIYSILNRLVANGRVRIRRGRYVPATATNESEA